MKRSISALALCVSLLVLLFFFLFPLRPAVAAKENVIIKLLNLPAPPPPNPLARVEDRAHDEKFYDKSTPPDDNAPIDDLIDYWTHQAGGYRGNLYYLPPPSDRTLARLSGEIAKNPELAVELLNVLPDSQAGMIKDLYDRGTEGGISREARGTVREWLRLHSAYFSSDLERSTSQMHDVNGYVDMNGEANLLALTRHDYDKAGPIINQLYADSSQPVSQALGTWALYRHALETGSVGDIDRYRSELMRMVENKSLPDGVRDMANDAICKEADFPGRDEWNLSLFDDETLVNMQSYTMLTTLVMYSPPDKYIPKMIGLLEKASSPTIRTAALHNLVVSLGREPSPDLERQIVESMLPWLEDPKWATNATWMGDARVQLVQKLSNYKIPESVPGLLKVLDESRTETRFVPNGLPANVTVNAMRASNSSVNAAALAANAMASAANAIVKGSEREVISYPYRSAAINALAKQQDGRAVRALRRVLQEVEGYERSTVVNAIFACGGFSIPEQIEGLETAIKSGNEAMNVAPANVSLSQVYARRLGNMPNPGVVASGAEIRDLLGQQIMNSPEITDALAQAIVERIDALAGKDDSLAQSYRSLILKWHNAVFNVLLLHDLKRDAADVDTIIRLLSDRKELREKQGTDVLDLQTGKPVAVGIAQCLLEDPHGYEAMLETGDVESRTAMLACARMIRAPLPVAKVAENLKSPSQTLQIAVERYLESEDSPEARALVLARHPNEAKILGATSAFYVEGMSEENENSYLWMLYQSLGDSSLYNGWSGSSNDDELQTIEKNLQTEVKKDDNLVGVYAYDKNYIRIYKDRAVISWDEDESRYRERPLTQEEFDGIKSYLATNKVDDLPPFLTCGGDYCTAKELVMLGRNGGRRVYMNSGGTGTAARMVSEFFAGLDKYFADLKLTHATLKYGLSREIPGLEIILASDELHAETVWKNGSDLRVAASLSSVRQQVKKDIDKAVDAAEAKDSLTDEEAGPDELKASLAEQRAYEGFGWHKVVKGDDGGPAVQPPGVDFIPGKDSYPVHATDEQWKARAAGLEVRGGDKGLYLISGGRATILQKGNFAKPVVSSNGRWAVAPQLDAEPGSQLVRVNLATRTVFPVKTGDYQPREPAAFVLILNKFLLVPQNGYDDSGDYAADHDNGPDDTVAEDDDPDSMLLLDAETGDVLKAKNEFRPLSQQTFRPLQKASKPDEYWAALPGTEKNETQLGIYNARWLTFKPVLLIPKIKFNSMSMWVDETEGKVYFVYRGHLLALPLRSQPPRVSGRSDR